MKIMTRLGMHTIDPEKVIRFPNGLLGFEDRREFTLLQISPGAPFLVLQSMQDPGLGLLVADPYAFIPDYSIHVGGAEQSLLDVSSAEQVAVLVTASIPHGKPEQATLNLTGPILINHEKRVGVQVPQPESSYPSRWRINQNDLTAPDAQAGPQSATAGGEEAGQGPGPTDA